MVNLLSKVAITGVAFVAVLYQFVFKTLIFDVLGYGRKVLSIKDYGHVRCQKIQEPGLEACEDMWMHEPTGHLYMACSDAQTRTKWLPAIDHFDASQRSLTDRIAVLDTRGKGPIAQRLKWLAVENFSGVNGDGTFNLHGMNILADKNTDTLRILLVNHRPSVDPATGELLDTSVVGANSTIEQFQTKVGSSTINHVRTYVNEHIQTPNEVTWVTDHSFVFTNDHSAKVGFRRRLDPFLGGGNVVYCDRSRCNVAYSNVKGPNGITKSHDGLVYVASTLKASIYVFALGEDRLLTLQTVIPVGLPLDNLSIDKTGDIYAAGFPKSYKWFESSKNPEVNPPSAVFRISRKAKGYEGTVKDGKTEVYEGNYVVEKVIEDDGSLLPGSTVAVNDPQTGRLFMAGIMSPFITICETR